MKRSIMASILGCITCLILALSVVAQAPTKTKEQEAAPKQAQRKSPPRENHWKEVENRGKTKKIWVLIGFKKKHPCPPNEADRTVESALLRLDASQYQEFTQTPAAAAAFVNDFDFFSCQIDTSPEKGLRRMSRLRTKVKAKAKGGDPIVDVIHDPDCGGSWYDIP